MNKLFSISAALAGLYLCFLTASHYWDGVLFSLYIEKVAERALPGASLFHPNHLLYSGFGYIVYELLHVFGLPVRSLTALQITNVLASTLCSAVILRLCTRLLRSSGLAISCTLLFALGATWWKFSTDANSYIISVLFSVAAVALVLRRESRLVAAGLCLSAAMLFHQLAIFGYVPIVVAVSLEKGTLQKRLRRAAIFVMVTAACVAVPYCFAYASTHSDSSARSFLQWITSVSTDTKTTQSFGQLTLSNALSYLKLFGGGKLGLIGDFISPPVVLALLFSTACLAMTIYGTLRRTAVPDATVAPMDRTVLAVLWSWLTAYFVFLSWFEPGNAFYKLFVWPALVLLIGLYLDRRSSALKQAFRWFALGLASWNFAAFIYPHSKVSADPVLSLAKLIDKELPKSATVYYKALSPDDWYLEYFAPGRRWEPLPSANDIGQGNSAAPVCFETTALAHVQAETDPSLRWTLVNGQHNIRLECLKPKTD